MKSRKYIVLVLLFFLKSIIINAQHKLNDNNYSRGLKFNLVSPFVGSFAVQYESSINKDAFLVLSGYYFTGQITNITEPFRGFGIAGEYRYYTSYKEMEGFYLQPFIRYQYLKEVQKNLMAYSTIGPGILFGYQSILIKNFVLDMYIGSAYNFGRIDYNTVNQSSYDPSIFLDNYSIRGGVSFGFLF